MGQSSRGSQTVRSLPFCVHVGVCCHGSIACTYDTATIAMATPLARPSASHAVAQQRSERTHHQGAIPHPPPQPKRPTIKAWHHHKPMLTSPEEGQGHHTVLHRQRSFFNLGCNLMIHSVQLQKLDIAIYKSPTKSSKA